MMAVCDLPQREFCRMRVNLLSLKSEVLIGLCIIHYRNPECESARSYGYSCSDYCCVVSTYYTIGQGAVQGTSKTSDGLEVELIA